MPTSVRDKKMKDVAEFFKYGTKIHLDLRCNETLLMKIFYE